VRRLAWSQLRFRSGRALALLAGMLVAATAFTVLTAAARTAQVRTIGTLSAHFRPAYDILVRPAGARTRLESATGTVQPDFLSGIYGGITMAQYHQIQHISGVQVAAPIAMVGYGFVNADFPVWVPSADVARPGRQLYRATTTWVSGNGASQTRQPPTYVYVTPDRVHQNGSTGATTETLPGGPATPCPAAAPFTSPFSYAALAATWCWSKINGDGAPGVLISPDLGNRPGFGVDWQFPLLIAAIDPTAEARLDGLNRAVTSGQYLPRNGDGTGPDASYFHRRTEFPVLAAADSGIGEDSVTRLQELATPTAPPVLNTAAMHEDATVPARTVLSTTISARQAYRYLLTRMRNRLGRLVDGPRAYWSAGPVRYRRASHGDLVPVAVRNPVSVWDLSRQDGIFYAPLDNAGTQYRTLRRHVLGSGANPPVPVLTGTRSPSWRRWTAAAWPCSR
jgi:putative ABC transport system permease protein